jgi:spore germination protein KC
MRAIKLLLLCMGIVCLLAGCWDRKELEQMSYTIAIGLDIPDHIDLNEKQAVDVTF